MVRFKSGERNIAVAAKLNEKPQKSLEDLFRLCSALGRLRCLLRTETRSKVADVDGRAACDGLVHAHNGSTAGGRERGRSVLDEQVEGDGICRALVLTGCHDRLDVAVRGRHAEVVHRRTKRVHGDGDALRREPTFTQRRGGRSWSAEGSDQPGEPRVRARCKAELAQKLRPDGLQTRRRGIADGAHTKFNNTL